MILNLIFKLLNSIEIRYSEFKNIRRKKNFKYCGNNVKISNLACIWGDKKFSIGDNSEINGYTFIFSKGEVEIGKNVLISANCKISSVTHLALSNDRIQDPLVLGKVVINDNVWLGMGVCILPGITIGKNSIIGAGSVVTKNIPENEIWVGNPARFLKKLNT